MRLAISLACTLLHNNFLSWGYRLHVPMCELRSLCEAAGVVCKTFVFPSIIATCVCLTNRLSIRNTSPLFSKSKILKSLKKYDVCGGPERFAERIFWSSAFAAEEHVRRQISLIFIKNTHLVAVQRENCNFAIIRQITFFENIAQRICYNLCYYLCYYVCYNHMLIFMLLFL